MRKLNLIYDRFLLWVVGPESFKTYMRGMPNRLAVTLNLIVGAIGIIYLVHNLIQGKSGPMLPHVLLIAGSTFGIVMGRLGKFEIAKIFLAVFFNIIIYITVAAGTYGSASHLYFFAIMIGVFVVFDHSKIGHAVILSMFSYGLYLLSSLSDISIIPRYDLSPDNIRFFYYLNTTIFTIILSVILVLYIRMINLRNERIKEQNDQLERSNQELDQFMYSTSHDLRAPLTTVLGLLNVIETIEDPKEKSKYYKLIKSSVYKMDHFIMDVIDLVKNSRLPVQSERLMLKEFVNIVFEDISSVYKVNGIVFENNISPNLEIYGDPLRLKVLYGNLISNSIKYSDSQKDHQLISVEAQLEDEVIELNVEDNGVGIHESQQKRIFEMFHKATEVSKGAGLGLYIVSEIVRKLNGDIIVESEMGERTLFKIQLPVPEVEHNTNPDYHSSLLAGKEFS